MSSELSRVKTYNGNRKKNQTKKPPSAKDAQGTQTMKSRPERKKQAASSLSRVRAAREKKGGGVSSEDLNRKPDVTRTESAQRNYRSRTERHQEGYGASHSQQESESAPARSETYGSRRNVISKYFTNSLFFLFLVLTAFLVYWGVKGAPPLGDLW